MSRRAFGRPRILPPRGLLIALLAQVPVLAAFPIRVTHWGVTAGVLLLGCGAVLNVWAERLFRRAHVGVCPFTEVPSLVTAGPYRITRNPMYVGLVLIAGAPPLLAGVPANLWSPLALALWLHFAFVLPEEEFLRQKLGLAWEVWAARVPRWLGLPGQSRQPGSAAGRELETGESSRRSAAGANPD